MPAGSRADLLPKAVIAALVGSVAGGIAGVWSLRAPAATISAAAPAPSPPAATADTIRVPPVDVATQPVDAEGSVLERARTLARRPDVMALMALREEVVRRTAEQGMAGSPSAKIELNELDERLNEARTLQLKLDAEAFRRAASKPAP